MKVEKISGKVERTVLTGMVVDKTVLGRIAGRWKEDLFKARWSNIVGGWCVNYFKEFKDAPKKNMVGLFESWASESQDKETVALVEKFLVSLSDEYEQLAKDSNSEYVLDLAGKHFERTALQRLAESVQGDLDLGKVKRAARRVVEYCKLDLGVGEAINVLNDKEAMQAAFEDQMEPILEYPGELNNFFKGQLTRDAFVAILAPEKRGKSWWLQDMAWRGMQQRRKVAFFSVGDLTRNQMMRRFAIRASRRPLRPKSIRYPKSIQIVDGAPIVKFEDRTYDKPLSWQTAYAASKEVQSKTRTHDELLRLSVHPMSSLSVRGIDGILDEWEREGWIPDIVIVDYADILDMPDGDDERSKHNAVWKALRGLSQKRHCLVITATQADAASYQADVLSRSNFSEDKRKLAHVTGMFALNQTADEKKLGVMRLNWIVLREEEFLENQCIFVAGCLAVANPAIRSVFGHGAKKGA